LEQTNSPRSGDVCAGEYFPGFISITRAPTPRLANCQAASDPARPPPMMVICIPCSRGGCCPLVNGTTEPSPRASPFHCPSLYSWFRAMYSVKRAKRNEPQIRGRAIRCDRVYPWLKWQVARTGWHHSIEGLCSIGSGTRSPASPSRCPAP